MGIDRLPEINKEKGVRTEIALMKRLALTVVALESQAVVSFVLGVLKILQGVDAGPIQLGLAPQVLGLLLEVRFGVLPGVTIDAHPAVLETMH
jgi:hypothetical protein